MYDANGNMFMVTKNRQGIIRLSDESLVYFEDYQEFTLDILERINIAFVTATGVPKNPSESCKTFRTFLLYGSSKDVSFVG